MGSSYVDEVSDYKMWRNNLRSNRMDIALWPYDDSYNN